MKSTTAFLVLSLAFYLYAEQCNSRSVNSPVHVVSHSAETVPTEIAATARWRKHRWRNQHRGRKSKRRRRSWKRQSHNRKRRHKPKHNPKKTSIEEHTPKLGSWTRAANYPIQVSEAQGNVAGGDFAVCGGFDHQLRATRACYVRRFSADGGAKWAPAGSMPSGVTHMATATDGGWVYFAGGFQGAHPGRSVRAVFRLHVRSRRWETLSPLPAPRAGGGLVFLRGKLLFAGGVHRPRDSLDGAVDHGSAWELNVGAGGAWKSLPSMPNPRNHMRSVEACGRVFWVGGQKQENEFTGNQRSVSEYVPAQRRWVQRSEMPVGTGHIAESVLPYKCGFFVVGGIVNGRRHTNRIWYYDAGRDKWSAAGQFPRSVSTPVCQLRGKVALCATGEGKPYGSNSVFVGRIE